VKSEPTGANNRPAYKEGANEFDAFVCHATEDKDVAEPIAELLRDQGFSIWYDRFELKVGDSLRRSIDLGLKRSRFGIVVLSEAFFSKSWPQYELDGLAEKATDGSKVILPIWKNLAVEELRKYSLSLANLKGLSVPPMKIPEVANEIAQEISRGKGLT